MVISYTTVIVGDFNLPKICWHNFTCGTDYFSSTFRDFAVLNDLCQFVNFSTRGENNLLDLVLSSDSGFVSCISPRAPIVHSDHIAVDFKLNVKRAVCDSNQYS